MELFTNLVAGLAGALTIIVGGFSLAVIWWDDLL